jgi:hypothetical protein
MHSRQQERETERKWQLQQLGERLIKIAHRRDAAYEDKLDGKLGEERWLEMDRKWSGEVFRIKCEMEAIGTVSEPSVDDVQATLELLQRAPELYRRQNTSKGRHCSECWFGTASGVTGR